MTTKDRNCSSVHLRGIFFIFYDKIKLFLIPRSEWEKKKQSDVNTQLWYVGVKKKVMTRGQISCFINVTLIKISKRKCSLLNKCRRFKQKPQINKIKPLPFLFCRTQIFLKFIYCILQLIFQINDPKKR